MAACRTIGLEGFYNPAFDTGGAQRRRDPDAGRHATTSTASAGDFEEIKGTMFTARFEHDFSDNVSLRNTSRYGKLHQFYVLTGVNALTVTSSEPGPLDRRAHAPGEVPGQHAAHQPDQHHRELDARAASSTPSPVASSSSTKSSTTRLTSGLGTPIPPANLYNPNRNDALPDYAPVRNGVYTRGETQTAGAYVFDTVTFAEHWQATARLPRRQLRDGLRQRGVVHGHHPSRRCPWARWCR